MILKPALADKTGTGNADIMRKSPESLRIRPAAH
jgi:hypothetical protein